MEILTKGSTEKICKYRIKRRERRLQKWIQKETLANSRRIRNSSTEDESIFVHDVTVRRILWLPKGISPVGTVTGSHKRTGVFGTFTMEGKQLFRQYDVFNQQDTFLDYLKQVKKRPGKKVIMFIDRARKHKSNKVQKYLEANKDSLRIFYFSKGSPNLMQSKNADGEGKIMICWYQSIIPNLPI